MGVFPVVAGAEAMIFSDKDFMDAAKQPPRTSGDLQSVLLGISVNSNAPVTGENPAGDIEAERCGADYRVRGADRHLESNSTLTAYLRPFAPPNTAIFWL